MHKINSAKIFFISKFFFCAVGIYTSGTDIALARWMTLEDAQHQTNYFNTDIYINKDGSSTVIKEYEFTILKENAKAFWSHRPILYNRSTTNFKILEAKTIKNYQSYAVNLEQIEDKPIASNNKSFDQINKITICYPQIDINSRTFTKTKEIISKGPMPDYYSNIFCFTGNNYVKAEKTHIVSELPLYIETNDPKNLIDISQSIEKKGNKTLYIIDIKQKRPFIQETIGEPQNVINPKNIVYVCVSSLKTWDEYGKNFSIEYEKIRNEKLPSLYQEIATIANKQPTQIEKINTVTSLLSEKINYLTDMRTIKGRVIPQHLQKVVDTRLGDCKDFSMATSLILDNIGIPSQLAFVTRGKKELDFSMELPNYCHFNHIILKVQLPNKILWIDPTNRDSMANNIFPDIANRKAIVLDRKNTHVEDIPPVDPTSNTIKIVERWDMEDPNIFLIKGNLKLTGPSALNFTGLQKFESDETIRERITDKLSLNYGEVLEKNIKFPCLTSRVVKDLSFDYAFKTRNSGLVTNAGVAFTILFNHLNKFETKENVVSDVYLGSPKIISIYTKIDHVKPQGNSTLNCDIKSPWVDFQRIVEYKSDQMIIHQKMKLKKTWLTSEDLQSYDYKNLKMALNKYVSKGIGIIFNPS